MTPKPLAFVIEDDPQLSQILTLTLQDNFDIQAIFNGAEAIKRLTKESPHIIVLDLSLPLVSGQEILTFIRTNERLKNITVILCTANERLADTLHDLADIILIKPVSPFQLKEIASRLK